MLSVICCCFTLLDIVFAVCLFCDVTMSWDELLHYVDQSGSFAAMYAQSRPYFYREQSLEQGDQARVWLRLPSDRKVNTVSLHMVVLLHTHLHTSMHTLCWTDHLELTLFPSHCSLSCVCVVVYTKFESTGQGSALSNTTLRLKARVRSAGAVQSLFSSILVVHPSMTSMRCTNWRAQVRLLEYSLWNVVYEIRSHRHTYTHTHVRTHARIHTHTHTHTHAHARTHARTHAHTHTHRHIDYWWIYLSEINPITL